VALVLVSASPRAQQANELLRRVGDWVQLFVEQCANVVAEEEYVPAIRSLDWRLRWASVRSSRSACRGRS
jgi:hypothetical protein